MIGDPDLIVGPTAGEVGGIALVLHGGRARSTAPVQARQLAVLRMVPLAAALRKAEGASGHLEVARLRYRVRGWNESDRSPVADARWALDELSRRHPGVPIALVGHSMGGRTAIYVADHPAVRVVVGLAPWLEDGDPVETVAGRRVLIVHGARDRMTSPVASRRWAAAAQGVAETISYVSVRDDAHAMLRRAEVWHRLSAEFVVGALFDRSPMANRKSGTKDGDTTNVVLKALAGEPLLIV